VSRFKKERKRGREEEGEADGSYSLELHVDRDAFKGDGCFASLNGLQRKYIGHIWIAL